MLSILAARRAGADLIVAIDISDFTLSLAKKMGADIVLNTSTVPDALDKYRVEKGKFDILYECSSVQAALVSAIAAMRPSGTITQLGLGGDMTLPIV